VRFPEVTTITDLEKCCSVTPAVWACHRQLYKIDNAGDCRMITGFIFGTAAPAFLIYSCVERYDNWAVIVTVLSAVSIYAWEVVILELMKCKRAGWTPCALRRRVVEPFELTDAEKDAVCAFEFTKNHNILDGNDCLLRLADPNESKPILRRPGLYMPYIAKARSGNVMYSSNGRAMVLDDWGWFDPRVGRERFSGPGQRSGPLSLATNVTVDGRAAHATYMSRSVVWDAFRRESYVG